MPKISKPLTDRVIKSLKAKDRIYKKSDGDSLYIAVNTQGKKYFYMEYKNPTTKKITRHTIGNYPDITLAQAREIKANLKKQIILDGLHEKKTFKEAAQEWMKIKEKRVSEKYFKIQTRYLEMYVFPFIADREIKSIVIKEILAIFEKIQDRKVYETQQRAFFLAREVFAFAREKQYVEFNIMADIKYHKNFVIPKVKHFATLTTDKDIRGLLLSIDEYNGDIMTKYALKLAIYTAQRPFNIRSAEWSEFDLNNGLWVIPEEKMKMGEKHIVPLAKEVVEFLNEYKNYGVRSKYLFPSIRSVDRPMSDNTVNSALRRMGYTKNEIVGHGFRAMFSTVCNEKREDHKQGHDIIELCLAHKERNAVRSAYNHALNLKERRELMYWWAKYLESLKTL